LDRQGRVIIPPPLRQYAEIEDEVVIVGSHTHLQLWAKGLWAVEKEYMSEHATEIAEAIKM
jgi:MraZ protein